MIRDAGERSAHCAVYTLDMEDLDRDNCKSVESHRVETQDLCREGVGPLLTVSRDCPSLDQLESIGSLEGGDLAHGPLGQEFGLLAVAVQSARLHDLQRNAVDLGSGQGAADLGVRLVAVDLANGCHIGN